jgi:hypothetical protein
MRAPMELAVAALVVMAFACEGGSRALAMPADAGWPAQGLPICTAIGDQVPRAVLEIPLYQPNYYSIRVPSGALIVWEDHRAEGPNGSDLYMQMVDPGAYTRWPAGGLPIASGPGFQRAPVAARYGPWGTFDLTYGGIVVAWIDEPPGDGRRIGIWNKPLYGGGCGGSWTATIAGSPCEGSLRLVGTEGYLTMLGWVDTSDQRVHLQEYDCEFNPQWGSAGASVGPATGTQSNLYMVGTPDVGLLVFWLQGTPGGSDTTYDLRLQRLTYEGVPDYGWPAQGAVIAQAGTHAPTLLPRFMADTGGGAVLVWGTTPLGDLTALFFPDGQPPAPPFVPRSLCVSPNVKTFAAACMDENTGNLAVAWTEELAGDRDVRAQYHPCCAGKDIVWGSDGRLVATGPADQTASAIVTERGGGAIIAWTDHSNGDAPYAVRLDASGELYRDWPAGGVILCDTTGDQRDPLLVTDDFDAAYAVWTDLRDMGTSGTDVYAQIVLGSGRLAAGVPPGVRAAMRVGAARPNPGRRDVRFRLELPIEDDVDVAIYDVTGRRVAQVQRGSLPAGMTELHWSRCNGTRTFPAGVYSLRIRTSTTVVSRRFVMLP